jgi:hypothetical protein
MQIILRCDVEGAQIAQKKNAALMCGVSCLIRPGSTQM